MLYSEHVEKPWRTFVVTFNPCIYFAVNPRTRKTEKTSAYWKACFSHGKHWRMMTPHLRLFLRSATTVPTTPSDTVHKDSSEGTKFTVLTVSADLTPEANATCTKTQVTNTDLDWQRVPAPPSPPSAATFSMLSLWSEHKHRQTDLGKGGYTCDTYHLVWEILWFKHAKCSFMIVCVKWFPKSLWS